MLKSVWSAIWSGETLNETLHRLRQKRSRQVAVSDETDNPARQNPGQKSRNGSLGEGGFQEMRTADLNESADPSTNSLNGPSGENGTNSDVDDKDENPELSELQLRIFPIW